MKKWLFYVLLCGFTVTFLISAVYLASVLLEAQRSKKGFEDLADIRQQVLATMPQEEEPVQNPTEETPTEPGILPELQALYEQNQDLAGWLSIPAINVDYPVMHAPDRKNYYLYRDFQGENNSHGSLYIWEEADLQTPSMALTVFGHHMKNGTMFGDLKKFQKKSFWEENQTFTLTSLYERREYRIFAVLVTTTTIGKAFNYHSFTGGTQEEYEEMVNKFKGYSLFETGITPEYGDEIVCLSTCDYSITNGRLVVVAVREK